MAMDNAAVVQVVDHLVCVNTYCEGFKVSLSSVRPPLEPYIRPSTSKKRKRSELAHNPTPPAPELLKHLELARHEAATQIEQQATVLRLAMDQTIEPLTSFNQTDGIESNESDQVTIVMQQGRQFLVPPRSSYYLGNIMNVSQLEFPQLFRFIAVDPPWPNKSVGRNNTYTTMDEDRLMQLRLKHHLDPERCIIAVWVTNKPSYMTFLLEKLLPHWGFATPPKIWTWLKVALNGEAVTPLNSMHRLPFERLVIAARGSKAFQTEFQQLPLQTLVSVPLRHSWKPPIEQLFPHSLVHKNDAKLELFARELRPGWTSIGNELTPMSTASSSEMTLSTATAPIPGLTVLGMVQFFCWSLLTINSIGDPLKTLYGYYMSTDSSFQTLVWEMEATNNFNNISSRVCNESSALLDCYYELPVDGTGSLAGSVCRSYYPVDKGPTQHVGNFFGNCTHANGDRIDIPNEEFASTQWSVQTSSPSRQCLNALGEGDPFPCDTTTTTNGHQIHYRPSHTEAKMWCKEFGGFFILNRSSMVQEVLLVNVSDRDQPSFFSLLLELNTPVFSLENLIGCPAHIHIGGTASQITTSAWYGETVGSWTAHTTRTANSNRVMWNGTLVHVWTLHYSEGDITIVRLLYKDIFRLTIVGLVVFYRITSIYYPIYLVYRRQQHSFLQWSAQSNYGLVVHKRERYNLIILFLLSAEAVASVEDIVVYCQHTVFTSSESIGTFLLNYMSIMRVIWPCSFVLLIFTRLLGCLFQRHKMFKLCENLFLLGAPVVMLYVPFHVTTQGVRLFQGYRWTGTYCHHFTNTIRNVYSNQIDCVSLFAQIFGWFILVNASTTFVLSLLWYWKSPHKSMLSYLFAPLGHRVNPMSQTLQLILQKSTNLPVDKEAHSSKFLCSSASNMAADGLVCLVYGNYHVVGCTEWGISYAVENEDGFVGVIRGSSVTFDDQITAFDLLQFTSFPMTLGIPELT